MREFNYYIFSNNEIIDIEYGKHDLQYYWYQFVYYFIKNIESRIKLNVFFEKKIEKGIKEVYDNVRKLNNLNINKSINFLFVTDEDIKNPKFYKALSNFLQKQKNRKPLISIGNFNIKKPNTYLPVNFLDSSIWNYYIKIQKTKSKSFSDKLNTVLKLIISNYINELYEITVSKEFFEFQTRILGNSHLGLKGGHAADVVPFVFHSEYIMKEKAKKILKSFKNLFEEEEGIKKEEIKWKILLVDDYGEKKLRGGKYSKEHIVTYILDTFTNHNLTNSNFKISFKIETTRSIEVIEDALTKIKTKQYDIILLDYLLGFDKEMENREYGNDFLEKLQGNDEAKQKKGPLGQFWIMPFTSFNNALMSKLKGDGIDKIKDDWYIMDGADIISTPNLFLYNFFTLIKFQLKIALVRKEDIIKFLINSFINNNNKKKNQTDKGLGNVKIRQIAKKTYGVFMNKFGLRESLKSDIEYESEFAKSITNYLYKNKSKDLRFYEYTRKLIYLIGFGTQHDAARMWNIYTYILDVVNEVGQKENKELLEIFANYINSLKKQDE